MARAATPSIDVDNLLQQLDVDNLLQQLGESKDSQLDVDDLLQQLDVDDLLQQLDKPKQGTNLSLAQPKKPSFLSEVGGFLRDSLANMTPTGSPVRTVTDAQNIIDANRDLREGFIKETADLARSNVADIKLDWDRIVKGERAPQFSAQALVGYQEGLLGLASDNIRLVNTAKADKIDATIAAITKGFDPQGFFEKLGRNTGSALAAFTALLPGIATRNPAMIYSALAAYGGAGAGQVKKDLEKWEDDTGKKLDVGVKEAAMLFGALVEAGGAELGIRAAITPFVGPARAVAAGVAFKQGSFSSIKTYLYTGFAQSGIEMGEGVLNDLTRTIATGYNWFKGGVERRFWEGLSTFPVGMASRVVSDAGEFVRRREATDNLVNDHQPTLVPKDIVTTEAVPDETRGSKGSLPPVRPPKAPKAVPLTPAVQPLVPSADLSSLRERARELGLSISGDRIALISRIRKRISELRSEQEAVSKELIPPVEHIQTVLSPELAYLKSIVPAERFEALISMEKRQLLIRTPRYLGLDPELLKKLRRYGLDNPEVSAQDMLKFYALAAAKENKVDITKQFSQATTKPSKTTKTTKDIKAERQKDIQTAADFHEVAPTAVVPEAVESVQRANETAAERKQLDRELADFDAEAALVKSTAVKLTDNVSVRSVARQQAVNYIETPKGKLQIKKAVWSEPIVTFAVKDDAGNLRNFSIAMPETGKSPASKLSPIDVAIADAANVQAFREAATKQLVNILNNSTSTETATGAKYNNALADLAALGYEVIAPSDYITNVFGDYERLGFTLDDETVDIKDSDFLP